MTAFVCVLGGIILLLCLPASVWVSLGGEKELWVGWLWFKARLVPQTPEQIEKAALKKAKKDEKAAKKQAKKDKKAAKKGKTAAKPPQKPPKSFDDITDMIGLALDIVGKATGGVKLIVKNLRVHDLTLKMVVAKTDAAETAIEYGKVSAYVFGGFAALQNYISMKNTVVEIKPNFLVDEGGFDLSFRALFTPLIVLCACVAILFGSFVSFLSRMVFKKQYDSAPPKNAGASAVGNIKGRGTKAVKNGVKP